MGRVSTYPRSSTAKQRDGSTAVDHGDSVHRGSTGLTTLNNKLDHGVSTGTYWIGLVNQSPDRIEETSAETWS